MILNAEKRSQFTIIVAVGSIDSGTEIRSQLSQAGYEVFLLRDEKSIIDRAKESAPHLIVFSSDILESDVSTFAQNILNINNEVMLALIASAQEADVLLDYRQYNFEAHIPEGPSLAARVIWAVDQICTQLYLAYQNEHLLADLEKTKEQLSKKSLLVESVEKPVEKPIEIEVGAKLKNYENCRSKEDLILQFYSDLNQKFKSSKIFSIFFKYLPTVHSFVATQGMGVDFENIKGVGSQLTEIETQNVGETLKQGIAPQSLQNLMSQAFRVQKFTVKPLFVHQSLDGLFVFWSQDSQINVADFNNDYILFSLLYQNLHLTRRNELLDNIDPVTDLYNRDTYMKKLNEEIARARRLQKPVSVVKLSLDHFAEIEQSLGAVNRDIILRSIAAIIRKTSRVNDFGCRTQDNEITLILPHCARKGAALRSERLRRTIENHSFSMSGHKITVSCGVSEYPTLSSSAADLEASASQALQFIVEKGGNKVCLYKPIQNFKPDFEVPPI